MLIWRTYQPMIIIKEVSGKSSSNKAPSKNTPSFNVPSFDISGIKKINVIKESPRFKPSILFEEIKEEQSDIIEQSNIVEQPKAISNSISMNSRVNDILSKFEKEVLTNSSTPILQQPTTFTLSALRSA